MTQSQLRYGLDNWLVHVPKRGTGGFSTILKQHPEMRLAFGADDARYLLLELECLDGSGVQRPVSLQTAVTFSILEGTRVMVTRPMRIHRTVSSVQGH